MSYRWIDDPAELDDLIDVVAAQPRYALDTEFHREKTYFPRLALVQLAWADGLVLIDPQALDPAPLRRLFAAPALVVAHAAQQDLDVLTHAIGAVPQRLFDTQVAAGFVGYGTPSLASLLQGELGVTPAEGRPVDGLAAAAAHRGPARVRRRRRRLAAPTARPAGRGAALARPAVVGRGGVRGAAHPPDRRHRPGDGVAQAEGCALAANTRARAIAQAVAAWREREAAATDTPVRQVLPDLAILGISQRQPSTLDELAQARGVDERHRRGRVGRELIAAVAVGKTATPPPVPDAVDEIDRSKRPAVTLVSAWVSQVARDARIDTALLATRADLLAVIRGDPNARLRPRLAGRARRRRDHPPDGRPRRTDVRRQGLTPPHRRLNRPSVAGRSRDAVGGGVWQVGWHPMSTR